jgi:hypothetical protein
MEMDANIRPTAVLGCIGGSEALKLLQQVDMEDPARCGQEREYRAPLRQRILESVRPAPCEGLFSSSFIFCKSPANRTGSCKCFV